MAYTYLVMNLLEEDSKMEDNPTTQNPARNYGWLET